MGSLTALAIPASALCALAAVEAGIEAADSDALTTDRTTAVVAKTVTEGQVWTVRSGTTAMRFDVEAMAARGLTAFTPGRPQPDASASTRRLALRRESTLTFSVAGGSLTAVQEGHLRHLGDVGLTTAAGEQVMRDLTITPARGEGLGAPWTAGPRSGDAWLTLNRVKAGFDAGSSMLSVVSPEVRISPALAAALGEPKLADLVIGSVTIRAHADWVGGADEAPAGAPASPEGSMDGGDMTFCQLYDFKHLSSSRVADICGMSVATTSWNVGTKDIMWFNIPDEEHPFIVMNAYRLMNDRFEQIGMSSIKHGFYALGSHQCGGPPCTFEAGHGPGDWLGTGCTDTYGSDLNGVQSGMGPRYEVNPWTGYWFFPGSHMDGGHGHDAVEHRIQIHDADLDEELNPGATYYGEGFYVILDDVDVMNSASWKPFSVGGHAAGHWFLDMTSAGDYPNIGFAIDAWPGATKTLIAQEIPVKEFSSPDGRCVLAAKATPLPDGDTWHYEYALLNVDLDRQVGSFSVPIPSGATVTNIGFHAVEHHDEPFNTADADAVPIDNAPWTPLVLPTSVSWDTDSNPIMWGMMYNFRFDADVPPDTTTVTVGHFRAGTPAALTAETVGPTLACPADIDGSGEVGFDDLLILLSSWGPCSPPCPPDLDGDGEVGFQDLLELLSTWGPCP
jgi:hypothetical protein